MYKFNLSILYIQVLFIVARVSEYSSIQMKELKVYNYIHLSAYFAIFFGKMTLV